MKIISYLTGIVFALLQSRLLQWYKASAQRASFSIVEQNYYYNDCDYELIPSEIP